jgi:hypothetical protein
MMKLSAVTAASMARGNGTHWAAIALAAFAGLQVLVLILAAKYAAASSRRLGTREEIRRAHTWLRTSSSARPLGLSSRS